MANKILKDVNLEDFAYPCITYALLRTGCTKSANDILKDTGLPYEGISTLEVGDILLWKKGEGKKQDATLTINDRGVITSRILASVHAGVYEGDGVASDLIFNDSYIPVIRMMHIKDGAIPNIVIKQNENAVNEK